MEYPNQIRCVLSLAQPKVSGRRAYTVLAFLIPILSSVFQSVYSQGSTFPPDSVKASLPEYLQKIDGHLRKTVDAMRDGGITEENVTTIDVKRRFSTPLVNVDANGCVHVYVRMKTIDNGVTAGIESSGGKVEYTNRSLSRLVAWIPFTQIEQLGKLEIVAGIDNIDKPYAFTGEVNTAGDGILKADQARTALGAVGTGVKVGVISDGVAYWDSSVASGDLPVIEVINNRLGGNEGTAMLEIVHDIAPNSSLAFADAGTSQDDFANNIDLLRNAGAKVIVDDIAYYAEPAFEDGVISQRVDNAAANGVVYVAAAGNQGDRSWDGQFKDNDLDGWHEFSGSDEDNAISFSTALDRVYVTLQWANKWGLAADDYDLYLYDGSGIAVAQGSDRQDGSGNPYEILFYWNDNFPIQKTLYLKIRKYSGSSRELKLLVLPQAGTGIGTLEHKSDYAIFHHASAASCISVGANPASNPEYVEYFSSHGPSRIYTYNGQGQPTSYLDRATPSQVGIDGVETKTGRRGFFPNPFYGTSAAAPHVAGITALLLSLNAELTVPQVKSITESTADKVQGMGGQGFTNQYGYGRTNAYNALKYALEHYGGTLTQTLTIPAGETWNFQPGVTVEFANDAQLVVHGKIDADYTTFQVKSGSTWYGIVVDGTQKSYFDYCTIKDGTHGLVVGGSTQWSPEVKHCYIQGRNDGIWIKDYGNPYVDNCYIKDSIFQAVKATSNANGLFRRCKLYGSSPYGHKNENSATPFYDYYSDGRNIIDGAGFTTASINAIGGIPHFENGYNSIPPKVGLYQYINSTGSPLNAQYNYWGGGAPVVSGVVNYSPFLGSVPNPVGPDWSLPKTGPGNDAVSGDALALAWNEYSDGNYNRSKQLAQSVFQIRKETEGSSEALFLWMKSALMEGSLGQEETDLLSLSTNSGVHRTANYESLRWLAKLAVYRREFKRAEEYALSIPNRSLYGREILLDLAVEILERWGDIARATSLLDKLTELYPDDETIREKESVLSSYGEYLSRNGFGPSKPSPQVTQQEINSTNLFQAYPNPFNPTTTIAYRIPQPGKVSLKVFDVLGREVATLVEAEQSEGEYSQRLDGSHLSSGIYFYRLIAPGINQTKKMLIAK